MSLTAIVLAASFWSGFGFDRVDVVAEDPGTWMNYDLPMGTSYPPSLAIRFLSQVKPVWTTPVEGLTIGTSLASQSVVYEQPLWKQAGLYWSAGLQTQLLMPRGALAGLAWRRGHFRIGAGVSAVSGSSWARPDWTTWSFLPTLGFGIGRAVE